MLVMWEWARGWDVRMNIVSLQFCLWGFLLNLLALSFLLLILLARIPLLACFTYLLSSGFA